MGAIFVYADNLGFKFSSYRFEGTPKSYKIQDLPTFAYIDDNDELHRVGGNSLSDGQLKALIHESKVIYVQMISKGIHWHAFIRTYQGLKGNESGTGVNIRVGYVFMLYELNRMFTSLQEVQSS